MLLGIPGDNTFSNYQEANRTFWRNTVIPLATRAARALADWLSPAYVDAEHRQHSATLTLRPDLDQIEALAPEREALWTRLEKASFLTDDEKRTAAGYGPKPILKFNPNHDDAGRFDFSPEVGSDAQIVLAASRGKGGIAKELLGLTVRTFVSQYCKGSIKGELPKQFDDMTVGDVLNIAKGGDAAARTCKKLLSEPRFRK